MLDSTVHTLTSTLATHSNQRHLLLAVTTHNDMISFQKFA